MEESSNAELIYSRRTELESLQKRIHELETENAKLSAQLSSCVCQKIAESDKTDDSYFSPPIEEMEMLKLEELNAKNRSKEKVTDTHRDTVALHHLPKRHVALKVMYFGQRFYGFASEAQTDPTIEVLSLFLRSNLRETTRGDEYSRESIAEESYGGEVDYVKLLNRVLPKDIRIVGWSPAPIDFSARFSCLSREYKYFFWREHLNILVMESAGKKFIGEHDFRNFCKMDAANVHNYRRHIKSFEIFPCNERFEDDELWAVRIKGSAFLWHQIRCMVAVLFLIGQGLESPNVIDQLLDVERTPRKPQYTMAPEIPLVLHSCEFEGLKFMCSSGAREALRTHLKKECRSYKLQAAIFHEALLSFSCASYENGQINSRTKKKESAHIPVMSRPTEPSYEERRAKLKAGGRR